MIDRDGDLLADFETLDARLDGVIAELGDPKSRVGGSDAAAVARERRMLGELLAGTDAGFDRAGELRRDYDRLGTALGLVGGAGSAAVARERRMVSALLAKLEVTAEVPLVDRLAENVIAMAPRRRASAEAVRSSA